MNFKKRIIISNTAIFLLPIIITLLFTFIFMNLPAKLFDKDMNYNNFKEITAVETELISMVHNTNSFEDNFTEEDFLKYLKLRLSSVKGTYLITKNDALVSASLDFSSIDVEKITAALNTSKNSIIISDTNYFLQDTNIIFKDGSTGNLILLAPVNKIQISYFKNIFIILCVILFLSFLCTNIFLSYSLSKRIVIPISLLKKATSEISKGNLNCEIIEDGDKEIKELCRDFETMRIQLKDSVHMKMKYDDNRTMLISSISHDLKTPITSIKGYVEGILDGVASTPEKLEMYLKTIYSKTEHIDLLIDDLLLYSKLDLNKIPFNFEKTEVIEYFKFCSNESEFELKKNNIKIYFENKLQQKTFVMIDRERMLRVFMNIIDNSKKYMDKPLGEIKVSLRETKFSVIIELTDNGVGINKTELSKVFDRFYRIDAARSEVKGSGLGLAIAKQIIEGHSGKIWAISEENEGTTILISLQKLIGE